MRYVGTRRAEEEGASSGTQFPQPEREVKHEAEPMRKASSGTPDSVGLVAWPRAWPPRVKTSTTGRGPSAQGREHKLVVGRSYQQGFQRAAAGLPD